MILHTGRETKEERDQLEVTDQSIKMEGRPDFRIIKAKNQAIILHKSLPEKDDRDV
jgi:hypothetical protein